MSFSLSDTKWCANLRLALYTGQTTWPPNIPVFVCCRSWVRLQNPHLAMPSSHWTELSPSTQTKGVLPHQKGKPIHYHFQKGNRCEGPWTQEVNHLGRKPKQSQLLCFSVLGQVNEQRSNMDYSNPGVLQRGGRLEQELKDTPIQKGVSHLQPVEKLS